MKHPLSDPRGVYPGTMGPRWRQGNAPAQFLKTSTIAWLLCCASAVATQAQVTKVAVLAMNEAGRPAADLLVVSLSADPGIAVLERAELERVMREQRLALSGPKGALEAGRLLGADGLILLETHHREMRLVMSVGLVAVKPGVLLRQSDHFWPPENRERWAELVARHHQNLWPRLATLPKDAVPVSILNLRSAVQSGPGEQIERGHQLLALKLSERVFSASPRSQ